MKILGTILFLIIVLSGKAQHNDEKLEDKTSVIISSGISFYSVIDKNISDEKYSGTLIPIKFDWRSNITKRQFRVLYFAIQTGTIDNFTVDARINELTLGWDYGFKLNKKEQYDIFLGPAPLLYFINRQQEISSQKYFNSSLGIVSLASFFGMKSNNLDAFYYEITGRLGLLSAGVSPKEDQQTKILTLFNGLQFSFSAQAFYKVLNWADIGFEYSFQTYNITAWNKMYSLSDQLTLNLIFSF
jgi:hypothetical protein